MEINRRKYPVGIQTFENIIKDSYIYVDKTDLVYKLAHTAKYVFLSRPRRFGKSLLSTTLCSYFRGDRELFEGLKIMDFESEWKKYPVIHLDLSTAKGQDSPQMLQQRLSLLIKPYFEQYGRDPEEKTPGAQLQGTITRANKQSGTNVILIIDEYDAPLLEVLHEKEQLEGMRKVMQEFYQPLKACERMVQFCFLTGITRFSQLSIFSTLNNILNVSMDPAFATICGITEKELTTEMSEDIALLAEEYECTFDEMHERLKKQYDGYHFSENSEEVYNPYSLMNCFLQRKIKNYWFESGTPTFLFQQMKRFKTDITKMDEIVASEAAFYRPTENLTDALPLLYQAGYLTIKEYKPRLKAYSLQIPNKEVRIGFTEGLLPVYSGLTSDSVKLGCAYKMWDALEEGNVDLAMNELKAFLAGVPYVEGFKEKLKDAATKEGFYECTFYLILSMLNVYVQTQVKCRTGRTDMIVLADKAIYVFEFKVNDTTDAALAQINENKYAEQFATDRRDIVKVGVSFDIDTWTIKEWKVE
ncbi:MAG: ATP-binding protein [Bacteroidales bacterium]|nr:ATP-binding protein [Bacteroidales bacterium]